MTYFLMLSNAILSILNIAAIFQALRLLVKRIETPGEWKQIELLIWTVIGPVIYFILHVDWLLHGMDQLMIEVDKWAIAWNVMEAIYLRAFFLGARWYEAHLDQ